MVTPKDCSYILSQLCEKVFTNWDFNYIKKITIKVGQQEKV